MNQSSVVSPQLHSEHLDLERARSHEARLKIENRHRVTLLYMATEFQVRPATMEDVPRLQVLIPLSVRNLRTGYSSEQVEAALGDALGVDTQLVRDGTYFVVEVGSELVGCGGWSRRRTLYGSDQVHATVKDDSWLDPAKDPARIRAFFVHPNWARRGIGSLILRTCEHEAARFGFSRLELAATLPGEPLYRAHGYQEMERLDVPLANGLGLPIIRMVKSVKNNDST